MDSATPIQWTEFATTVIPAVTSVTMEIQTQIVCSVLQDTTMSQELVLMNAQQEQLLLEAYVDAILPAKLVLDLTQTVQVAPTLHTCSITDNAFLSVLPAPITSATNV